jgi:hypothetical protein
MIHEHFCCIANSLRRRAFGRRARHVTRRFHDEPS